MISSRALHPLSILSGTSFCSLFRGIHGGITEGGKEESSSIHPTALIHPDAILGKRISVGPFCTVGSEVKIGNACQLQAGSHVMGNTELGDDCSILSGAIVGADLPGRTIIGSNNVIGYHAVIGVKCQDLKYKAGTECFLIVGDNNDIREFASIHRSSKSTDTTVIGDGNLIMGSCHIAHDCKVGNNNILANNTLLAGHVVIEDFTHTAGAVHQFCHVGSYSFIGGGSVVQTMRKAYRKIFMSSDTTTASFEDRLSEVEHNREMVEVSAVCSMVKSIRDSFTESRRGICKYKHLTGC